MQVKGEKKVLHELTRKAAFEIAPFDVKAAMECSLLLEDAWSKAEKRAITKTKFKYDWQIVAIAASRRVTTIYSDDGDVSSAAAKANIQVIRIDDLALPLSAAQGKLNLS